MLCGNLYSWTFLNFSNFFFHYYLRLLYGPTFFFNFRFNDFLSFFYGSLIFLYF